MRHETLDIDNSEHIEIVSCCWSPENHRIRSITLWTNYEKCLIMEGEVELKNILNVSESLEEFSKIDNESILPESEMQRSSNDDIIEDDKSKDEENNAVNN